MAKIILPEDWRADVCTILSTESPYLIIWTRDAADRYQRSFPAAFPRDVYEPLIRFLKGPNPMGCAAHMDYPRGETYEFLFNFYFERIHRSAKDVWEDYAH